MTIIYELNEQHIGELNNLYQQEWWTKGRSLDETQRCVKGSQINIGILDKSDALIAYARVLTDFTFKAIIFDVIVDKEHRGQGLGDQLLSLIKQHKQLAQVKNFELYCLPEMFSFYEKHGFSAKLGEIKLMRRVKA